VTAITELLICPAEYPIRCLWGTYAAPSPCLIWQEGQKSWLSGGRASMPDDFR